MSSSPIWLIIASSMTASRLAIGVRPGHVHPTEEHAAVTELDELLGGVLG